MGRRDHYHVYLVELSKDVLLESKFNKRNPGYITGKPCVYVGMTGLDPDVRFDKHKAGIQSNRYAKQYGLRLLPDLYEGFNPMTYEEACDKEIEATCRVSLCYISWVNGGFGAVNNVRWISGWCQERNVSGGDATVRLNPQAKGNIRLTKL